ncbi:MAG: discoidin domain-containing protein [Actinomycetota bacterium]|nr:discoidin domain-containing protein [Actinomycetota bacterium]
MNGFPTQLECPGAEVRVDRPLRCQLRIYNPAQEVDEFTVTGLGPAGPWISTTPDRLSLLPQQDGELEVTLAIPQDARLEAGRHVIHLRVDSSLHDVEPQTEELVFYLPEITAAALAIEPRAQTARISAHYSVEVTNRGNHPFAVDLTAPRPDTTVEVNIDPAQLQVPPFTPPHAARLSVSPVRPKILGKPVEHPITVEGRSNGLQLSAQSTLVLKPFLAPWILPILLVIGLAVLIVPPIIGPGRDGPTPTPTPAPTPPSPTPQPSPTPTEAVPLAASLIAAEASSTHPPYKNLTYGIQNTIDGDKQTAWNSNESATGQWLRYTFDRPYRVVRIDFTNGYVKDDERFRRNHRLKDIRVVTDTGTFEAKLQDIPQTQTINKEFGVTNVVEIEVLTVYEAQRYNNRPPYKDLALTEVIFYVQPR